MLFSKSSVIFNSISGKNCQRFIHTSAAVVLMGKNNFTSVNREVKTMNKILSGRKKDKKVWYGEMDNKPRLLSVSFINSNRGQGKESSRRINVLNKLFMKNITDLMATGNYSDSILGKQIEISKVKVTNDFQRVNVYWLSKGGEADRKIQEILNEAAISIRHELSQLRLMGEVPRINFLKDKSYFKTVEVQNILEYADFGDDNTEYLNEEHDNDNCGYTNLPAMRQDVFGLNRAEIMDRLTRNMKKTKHAWDRYEIGADTSASSASTNLKNAVETQAGRLEDSDDETRRNDTDASFKKYLERLNYNKPSSSRKRNIYDREYIEKEIDEPIEVQNDVDYLDDDLDTKKH